MTMEFSTPTQLALGTCYYPEQWPRDKWQEDALHMAKLGLTWVRIAEFSWGVIEPTPGDLNWQWLDDAIDILGQAGLKVVLGTPSATPPRWMLDKWPDMLATLENLAHAGIIVLAIKVILAKQCAWQA